MLVGYVCLLMLSVNACYIAVTPARQSQCPNRRGSLGCRRYSVGSEAFIRPHLKGEWTRRSPFSMTSTPRSTSEAPMIALLPSKAYIKSSRLRESIFTPPVADRAMAAEPMFEPWGIWRASSMLPSCLMIEWPLRSALGAAIRGCRPPFR